MTELFALAAITTLLYLTHKVRVWQWSKKPECTCTDADHNPALIQGHKKEAENG